MVYQICNIASAVRIILDQNTISDQLIETGDVDTLSLNEIIENKIADATRCVEMAVPNYMLETGCNFSDAVYWGNMGNGWTILPDDFMRLIAFKMSDWERTLHTAILESDPLYAMQSSRYKGLRGTPQKPVCAIVMRSEGKSMEFYSCKDDTATVVHAVYLPIPTVINGGIDISDKCYSAVLYYTAGLVAQSLGIATASSFFEISKSLML